MPRPANLTKFSELAGVPVHWGSWGRIGSRFLCEPFMRQLEHALGALWDACPLGVPDVILSDGAFVDREPTPGDRHATGTAFDLSGFGWPSRTWVTLDAPSDWGFYLAIEAVLRKHLDQVLNWWQPDRKHKGHWHIDDRPVGGFQVSSYSDVVFLQAALMKVWHHDPGYLDGKIGPRTLASAARALNEIGQPEVITSPGVWLEFLEATIRGGFGTVERVG